MSNEVSQQENTEQQQQQDTGTTMHISTGGGKVGTIGGPNQSGGKVGTIGGSNQSGGYMGDGGVGGNVHSGSSHSGNEDPKNAPNDVINPNKEKNGEVAVTTVLTTNELLSEEVKQSESLNANGNANGNGNEKANANIKFANEVLPALKKCLKISPNNQFLTQFVNDLESGKSVTEAAKLAQIGNDNDKNEEKDGNGNENGNGNKAENGGTTLFSEDTKESSNANVNVNSDTVGVLQQSFQGSVTPNMAREYGKKYIETILEQYNASEKYNENEFGLIAGQIFELLPPLHKLNYLFFQCCGDALATSKLTQFSDHLKSGQYKTLEEAITALSALGGNDNDNDNNNDNTNKEKVVRSDRNVNVNGKGNENENDTESKEKEKGSNKEKAKTKSKDKKRLIIDRTGEEELRKRRRVGQAPNLGYFSKDNGTTTTTNTNNNKNNISNSNGNGNNANVANIANINAREYRRSFAQQQQLALQNQFTNYVRSQHGGLLPVPMMGMGRGMGMGMGMDMDMNMNMNMNMLRPFNPLINLNGGYIKPAAPMGDVGGIGAMNGTSGMGSTGGNGNVNRGSFYETVRSALKDLLETGEVVLERVSDESVQRMLNSCINSSTTGMKSDENCISSFEQSAANSSSNIGSGKTVTNDNKEKQKGTANKQQQPKLET